MSKTARRAQAAARWGFLGDWITTLQQHLYYHEREELDCDSLHSEFRSFCVYIPWPVESTAEYENKVTKLREAMELVGLALELDKTLWQLIPQPGNDAIEEFDPDDYDDVDLTPRYLIKAYCRRAEDPGDTVETIEVVEALLLKHNTTRLSLAYRTAREQIYKMDTTGALTNFQIPISLVFTPASLSSSETEVYLKTATEITRELYFYSGYTAGSYPFTITGVVCYAWNLRLRVDANGDNELQSFCRAVLTRGIAIPEIALDLEDVDDVGLGRLLQLICCPLRLGRRHACCPTIVDALMISSSSSLEHFFSVCSAITSAETLSRLQLYAVFGDGEDRRAKWKALGLALLSCASSSSVRELYISEDRLLVSDAAALQAVTASPSPIATVLDGSASIARSDDTVVKRRVQLSERATIKLRIDGDAYSREHLQLFHVDWYPVVSDNDTASEWMRILAPGYGIVYVRCEDVVDLESVASPTAAARRSRLTQLHLAYDHSEPGTLPAMLRVLGASLVSLDVSVKYPRLVRADDVKAILTTCRALRMLRLCGAMIGSMKIFTQAYENETTPCRVSSLSLTNVYACNPSLHAFAMALSDPTRRIATTLTSFRYNFDQVASGRGVAARPGAVGVTLFLRMLAHNATLSFFELALDRPFYERFAERFRDCDGRVLVSHPCDLPLATRLAFVSCIRVVTEQKRSGKRVRTVSLCPPTGACAVTLTKELVAQIFSFARRRIYRVVSVTRVMPKAKKKIM